MHPKAILSSLLLTLAVIPAVSSAQGVSLRTGLTDFTTWNLTGSASALNKTPGNGFTYSQLFLTDSGTADSAGAAFAPAPVTLDFNEAFSFDFSFYIRSGAIVRGDGFTFTLSGAPGVVGNGGSDLGYGQGDFQNSVAFAVDTFHFDGEPVSPSIQILQNGDAATPLAFTETGLGDAIRDTEYQWYGVLNYTPSGLGDETGELAGTIQNLNLGDFSVSARVNLSALGDAVSGGHEVYYGFTAGNGLADDGHEITSAAAVPVPAALWLFGSALLGMAGFSRRKRI